VSFTGVTVERLATLADPQAAARARQLIDEIALRRAQEEAEGVDEGTEDGEGDE